LAFKAEIDCAIEVKIEAISLTALACSNLKIRPSKFVLKVSTALI